MKILQDLKIIEEVIALVCKDAISLQFTYYRNSTHNFDKHKELIVTFI